MIYSEKKMRSEVERWADGGGLDVYTEYLLGGSEERNSRPETLVRRGPMITVAKRFGDGEHWT